MKNPLKGLRDLTTDLLVFMGLPYGFGSTSLSKIQAMQLSVVYRCVEVKSNAISTPTILVQDKGPGGWINTEDDLFYMLNMEPWPTFSKTWFMKMLSVKKELEGNAFARIYRDNQGNPVGLRLILDHVKMYVDDFGIAYYLVESKTPELVEQSDMIHIKNFSYDGLMGVSTLTHANNTLTIADAEIKHAKGFFTGGGNASMIIKVEGRLTPERAAEIKSDVQTALDATSSDGSPNSALVMDSRMTAEPIPTVSPRDAQMLESRRFETVEICRFFGVTPPKVFETREHKYNTVEAMQLAFLTDTAGPEFEQFENEFDRKLFGPIRRRSRRIRFEVSDLLRADFDTQANYRRKMTEIGAFTPDDNRKFVGLPPMNTPGAQVTYMPANLQPTNLKSNEQPSE